MNNRTTLILLGVVVALVVVVAVLFVGTSGTKPAGPATQTPGQTGGQGQTASGPPTKVPIGTKPQEFVEQYYKAILADKWEKAWSMQPATNKASGDAKAFAQTQKGYGMKSFKVTKTTNEGAVITVMVRQDLGQNGKWDTLWTFERQDRNWVAASKKSGMAQ